MNLKALRRPHDAGRTKSSGVTTWVRAQRRSARAHLAPGAARLVGRWTVAADGRLEQMWAFEPERPAHHLTTRKRGSDD